MTDIPGPPEDQPQDERYFASPPMAEYEPPAPPPPPTGPWPPRRRRPHFAELLGAVGGVLAIFGLVTVLSELVDSKSGAAVAAVIAAGVVVAAYVGLTVMPTGPVASALVVVSLLGAAVPMPFIVATQDNPGPKGAATLVLLVPTLAWAFCYFAGPGRARLPYLGAALLGLWLLVGVQAVDLGGSGEFSSRGAVSGWTNYSAEGSGTIAPVEVGLDVDAGTVAATFQEDPEFDFEDDQFDGSEGPSFFEEVSPFNFFFGDVPENLGFVSLLFGAGYLAAAVALTRRRAHGGATPFVAIGNLALVSSITLLGGPLENVGTFVYAVLVGGSLCWFGSWTGRRLTSWLGALTLAGGLLGLVSEITQDEIPGGVLLVLAGALTVVAASQIAGPSPVDEEDAVAG